MLASGVSFQRLSFQQPIDRHPATVRFEGRLKELLPAFRKRPYSIMGEGAKMGLLFAGVCNILTMIFAGTCFQPSAPLRENLLKLLVLQAGTCLTGLLSYALFSSSDHSLAHYRPMAAQAPDPLPNPQDLRWPQNVTVLTVSSQRNIFFSDTYPIALKKALNDRRIQSLEGAHQSIAERGIKRNKLRMFPLPVLRKLSSWRKDEPGKERFIFSAFVGEDNHPDIDKEHIKKSAKRLKETLRKTFNVPDGNIDSIDQIGREAIFNQFSQFRQRLEKALEDGKEVEVAILLNGHGFSSTPSGAPPSPKEGALNFMMSKYCLDTPDNIFFKADLLKLLKTIPSEIPTTVIVDACHSGACINY